MVGTAGAAEVLAIVKRKRIAAMICNPKLSADDVIDFSRSRATFAEHGNAAKRIIEKDGRDGVLAPVFRVVELLESKLSTLRVAGAEETDLAIVFLMGFTVRGTGQREFRTVAADAASGFGHSQSRFHLERELQSRVGIRRDRQYRKQRSAEIQHADKEIAATGNVATFVVRKAPAADDRFVGPKRRERIVLGLIYSPHGFAFSTCWQNGPNGFHANYLKASSCLSG
jgi:hypothetical protein